MEGMYGKNITDSNGLSNKNSSSLFAPFSKIFQVVAWLLLCDL